MLGFDKFFENKTLMFSAGAVAFLVAALLILFIFRLAFGRRLHMPGGGRARQPRLGIVDAFDLDRQRQLVLIRRDNVEHLLMIGGPNDLLIEAQIVRAEAREAPRPREKEPAVAPLSWPAGGTQPSVQQAPTLQPPFPQPALQPSAIQPPSISAEPKLARQETVLAVPRQEGPAPIPEAAATEASSPVPLAPAPAAPPARPPFLPLPPRRTTPPPSFGFKPAAPLGPRLEGAGSENNPLPPSPPPRSPISPPSFLRPRPAPLTPPPVKSAADTADVQPSSPAASAVLPPPPPKPEQAPATTEALDSLEEEMAKLLGRNPTE